MMALPAVTSAMRQDLAAREEQTRADLAWLAFRHTALRQYTDQAGILYDAAKQGGNLDWRPGLLPMPEDIVAQPEHYWTRTTLGRFKRTFKLNAVKQPSQNYNHYVNQVVVVFAAAVLEAFLEDVYEIRSDGASLKTPRGLSRNLRTYIRIIDGLDPGNLKTPPTGTSHMVVDAFQAAASGASDVMDLAQKRNDIVHAQTRRTVSVAIDVTMRQLEHAIQFVSDTVSKLLGPQARAR